MQGRSLRALCLTAVLALTPASHGLVIGDFEDALDAGWSNRDPGSVSLSFTGDGATLNSFALRIIDAPAGIARF